MTQATDTTQLFDNLKKTFEKIYGMKWSDDKALFTQFGLLYFAMADNHTSALKHNALMERLDKLSLNLGK